VCLESLCVCASVRVCASVYESIWRSAFVFISFIINCIAYACLGPNCGLPLASTCPALSPFTFHQCVPPSKSPEAPRAPGALEKLAQTRGAPGSRAACDYWIKLCTGLFTYAPHIISGGYLYLSTYPGTNIWLPFTWDTKQMIKFLSLSRGNHFPRVQALLGAF